MSDILNFIEVGCIVTEEGSANAADLAWNPHPRFSGVHLRNVITGSNTNGEFSVHLVRIGPGMEIGEHFHQDQTEFHFVLAGDGKCVLGERTLVYRPGNMAVMPPNAPHRVAAGAGGLVLQAVFSPALA